MSSFHLRVIAIDKVFFDGECRQVIVTGTDGLFGIMAHHENAVIALVEGSLQIELTDGSWLDAASGIGHVQVIQNEVTVILDFAEKPEEIDEKRAREAMNRATEAMQHKQSIQEFHMSQANISRAMARLAAKKHMRDGYQ
ncbi:MAG: ATP synthase F1 subunit epsilon [Lachnospiraceae bacterium]